MSVHPKFRHVGLQMQPATSVRHVPVALLFAAALGLLTRGQTESLSGHPQSIIHNMRSEDQAFLREAVRAATGEIQVSEIAEQQSQNPDIRRFAENIQRNHGRSKIELQELAKTKGGLRW